MWKVYNEMGQGLVKALAERHHVARHEGPGSSFYPNKLRFLEDDFEARFTIWEGSSAGFAIETEPRIQGRWDEAVLGQWRNEARKLLAYVKAVRKKRLAVAMVEKTHREAATLSEQYALTNTPLRMIGMGTDIRMIMSPVDANETQVQAMLAAGRACGLW